MLFHRQNLWNKSFFMKEFICFLIFLASVPCMMSSDLIRSMVRSYQSFWYPEFSEWLSDDLTFYYTPLDSFRFDYISDTIYFRGQYPSDGLALSSITIWNNRDSLKIFQTPRCSKKSKLARSFEYWEEELIEKWDIDSIKALTHLPANMVSPPDIYLARFIISNGNCKIDTAHYEIPGIPDELADSATLRYRQKRAERLGYYTRY